MSNAECEMTPEQVAEGLNKAKWRGREDWFVYESWSTETIYISCGQGAYLIYGEDAREIAFGLQAQDELAVQTRRADLWEEKADKLRDELLKQDRAVAALTEENERLRNIIPVDPKHPDCVVLLKSGLEALDFYINELRADALTERPAAPAVPYKPWLTERLQNPNEMIGYLEAALEEDESVVRLVLQDTINALRRSVAVAAPDLDAMAT